MPTLKVILLVGRHAKHELKQTGAIVVSLVPITIDRFKSTPTPQLAGTTSTLDHVLPFINLYKYAPEGTATVTS